jgi:hypothetical protein
MKTSGKNTYIFTHIWICGSKRGFPDQEFVVASFFINTFRYRLYLNNAYSSRYSKYSEFYVKFISIHHIYVAEWREESSSGRPALAEVGHWKCCPDATGGRL